MKRSPVPPDLPRLFDPPLGPDSAAALAEEENGLEPEAPAAPSPRSLFAEQEAPGSTPGRADAAGDAAGPERAGDPGPASPPSPPRLASRAAAGALDLGLNLAVLVVALVGARMLGVEPRLSLWPAIAVFLAVFSFLYISLPLAFWGQTPGMARARLAARNEGDQPLTFGQTALRWLGAALTVLALGLPLLLALGGGSLADRLSGSATRVRR